MQDEPYGSFFLCIQTVCLILQLKILDDHAQKRIFLCFKILQKLLYVSSPFGLSWLSWLLYTNLRLLNYVCFNLKNTLLLSLCCRLHFFQAHIFLLFRLDFLSLRIVNRLCTFNYFFSLKNILFLNRRLCWHKKFIDLLAILCDFFHSPLVFILKDQVSLELETSFLLLFLLCDNWIFGFWCFLWCHLNFNIFSQFKKIIINRFREVRIYFNVFRIIELI